jgi:DMSO/TMAO reductase YedYZ molybdopterin-dependent catalytic subunit
MKKKIFLITLICVVLAGFLVFFSYSIYQNEASKRPPASPAFDPSKINIDEITDDIEFASIIPEYNIQFTGLVEDEQEISFIDIVSDYGDLTETRIFNGLRSDGEEVNIEFTGVKIKKLLENIPISTESENSIIYATDLYAANFTLEELYGDDVYLVWKKDGQYLNPSEDGVLKIVQDNGPTNKWVKNPVIFDFIGEYKDKVPIEDRLEPNSIDFISEQQLFTLTISYIPEIDINDWVLEIKGLVENPVTLTYEELTSMPQISVYATLETISNPEGGSLIGNAIWTGVPLKTVLDMAGVEESAIKVIFFCEDGYSTAITIEEAFTDDVVLAYKMNGKELTPEHGYPLRVVIPEKYGMKWAKWIISIEPTDQDYKGYWESRGWSDYAGRDRPDQRFD